MTSKAAQQSLRPRIITLGTAGGPQWWRSDGSARNHSERSGIATAVVVGQSVYLVDAGHGVGRQLAAAGLSMSQLRGVFITHLHSDHTVDLPSLLLFGTYEIRDNPYVPIKVLGPGDRGALPPVSPQATEPVHPIHPEEPTPGISSMIDHLTRAYATDLNDRILDGLRRSPSANFTAQDIVLPEGIGYDPNLNATPPMEPFVVYRDELVTVTAILVQHPPVAPAFAFRFDCAEGSVTISGDTAPCENLVRLARHTDLLLHEAIDEDWLQSIYGTDANVLDDKGRAGLEHHRKAHTTAAQAAELAQRAGAATLALHHLVPGTTPAEHWKHAAAGFPGPVLVPADLDSISFRSTPAAPTQ